MLRVLIISHVVTGTMPCPFLARLSPNYIRNYGPFIIINFPQHCPIMSRMASSSPVVTDSPIMEVINSKCPFLSKEPKVVKEANPAIKEDIINVNSMPKGENNFHYEKFFHENILQKKKDHSYR